MDAYPSDNNDHALIKVRGQIDWTSADILQRRLIALAHPMTGQIALDLSQVSFIDCAGLHMLTLIDQQIHAHGGQLRIVAASPAVARLIELTASLMALPECQAPRRRRIGRSRTHAPPIRRPPSQDSARARPR